MQSFTKFFSGLSDALNPKRSSFSGAMDVIVIQGQNEELNSTAFHLKFGRFKLGLYREKKIDLIVNGTRTGILMKLSNSGKGYFLRDSNKQLLISKSFVSTPETLNSLSVPGKLPKIFDNPDKDIPVNEVTNDDMTLTSDELKLLNLNMGVNIIHYSVRTNEQVLLSAKVYLWDYRSKMIISDIDGTVTKSDILGHLYYIIGKDWKREGVVGLYKKMRKRGYQILYLSARPLDQIDYTRGYLAWAEQDGEHLPDGPTILSPNGLFTSFKREILSTSHTFKTKALEEIMSLIPEDEYPFIAGFGNKKSDAIAYTQVGMPKDKVFIFEKNKKNDEFFSAIRHFDEIIEDLDVQFPEIDDYILIS